MRGWSEFCFKLYPLLAGRGAAGRMRDVDAGRGVPLALALVVAMAGAREEWPGPVLHRLYFR